MRASLVVVVACAALIACVPTGDKAHISIVLPAPYATLPSAPPGTPIQPGRPVSLDARQQEAVVLGVMKWMKEPASVRFGAMDAVQNRHKQIVVCGLVDGRNTAGSLVGLQPFIGVLMGASPDAEFVLVGIGSSNGARAEVSSLCRESGIYGVK